METKDETFEIRNQELRKKLWCDVYVAYVASSNSVNKEFAVGWANKALEKFDETFITQ